jgi:DNA-directed RNA polymerase subunit RPC12/RpoP
MDLVEIDYTRTGIDIYLVKAMFEGEGIESHIFGEFDPRAGKRLIIGKDDEQKAMGIISDLEQAPWRDDNNQPIRCPACGTYKIDRDTERLFFNTFYSCRVCGEKFEMDNE